MNESERAQFGKIMVALAELHGKTLSAAGLDLWWQVLSDWGLAEFKAAANRLVKTCAFMPKPKDFHDLRSAEEPTGGEVFADLSRWFDYTPFGYRLKEDTPRAIASAVRAIGGPDAYAMCESEKLHFLERRFCQHYEQISAGEQTREAMLLTQSEETDDDDYEGAEDDE